MRQRTNFTPDAAAYRAVLDAPYRKSTYSNGSGGCVSIAACDGLTGVQDSKLPADHRRASTLVFSDDAMRGFLRELRNR